METPEVITLPELLSREEGQSTALAIPVEIVPAIYAEPVTLGIQRAYKLEVTDEASYKVMAEVVNMLKKFDSTIKGHTLALGRPFRDRAAMITAEGDKFRAPIAPAYQVASNKMLAWKKLDDARIAAIAEAQCQERLKIEAQQQALADAKAKLEREALAAEEAAAKKIENAKTDKAREKAIAEGIEAQKLREQAAAIPEPSAIPFVAQAPLPTAATARGVKTVKSAVLHSTDVTKLPAVYLLVNEALLKRHILDGAVTKATPGVSFSIEEKITGIGR